MSQPNPQSGWPAGPRAGTPWGSPAPVVGMSPGGTMAPGGGTVPGGVPPGPQRGPGIPPQTASPMFAQPSRALPSTTDRLGLRSRKLGGIVAATLHICAAIVLVLMVAIPVGVMIASGGSSSSSGSDSTSSSGQGFDLDGDGIPETYPETSGSYEAATPSLLPDPSIWVSLALLLAYVVGGVATAAVLSALGIMVSHVISR